MSALPTHIRSCHPSAFHSGEWAEILTTAPDPEQGDMYIVRFSDGATDEWVANDPVAEYEFRYDDVAREEHSENVRREET